MTKVAVILSGCGHHDGAEIREAVLSLLYLDQHGAEVSIFAPDIQQKHTVNHMTQQEMPESRNVMFEAARIARGKIEDLTHLKAENFDALVIPGGYGVAKNLSNLADKGAEAQPIASFLTAVQGFYKAGKPIGAICIAPVVVASCLRGEKVMLTIGDDPEMAAIIEAMGNIHKPCATNSFVFDKAHKIASCPAYMRDDSLADVAKGIEQVIGKVIECVSRQALAA